MSRKIKKVLVANRGEIAIRVMRTLRLLGIESVAVYSDADSFSNHLSFADESYNIGEPKSYLDIEKIVSTAKNAGCDAVHPGYGFLAENPNFARRVMDEGLIWIGPSPECMRNLGDKINSRKIAYSAGISTTPGGTIDSMDQAYKLCDEIGYPVLIKASAGGGGKGMRIVNNKDELERSIKVAQEEAKASFSDPTVYIEKYIRSAHHIEIQFLRDEFGNGLYFPERECSVQRRYQKIIEESPSPTINRETAKKMGESALKIVSEAGYVGAGTVEFIYDEEEGKFYFLEVNARIQVEHPVTEEISSLDLIEKQIEIAEGKELEIKQEELNRKVSGHAIESRIYAEDPYNNFAPSIGKIEHYVEPKGIGIRVDSGFSKDSEVSIYYDSLIAKLIVKAENRSAAIKRMYDALSNYHIAPVKTTIPILKKIFSHRKFVEGKYTTKFIDIYKDELLEEGETKNRLLNEAIAIFEASYKSPTKGVEGKSSIPLCWDVLTGWRG